MLKRKHIISPNLPLEFIYKISFTLNSLLCPSQKGHLDVVIDSKAYCLPNGLFEGRHYY